MKGFFSWSTLLWAASMGAVGGAQTLTATLKLKGRLTMEQLAENVANPASDHYRRAYEPLEIRQVAGPSDADYNELLAGLRAEGMTIVKESPTHLWVSVKGPQAIYESLFTTQIQGLGGGVHKKMKPLLVPVHLNLIESVSGLDNTRKSYPKYKKMESNSSAPGFSPDAVKSAYGFQPLYASGLSGKNVQIAIATYNSFNVDNVNQFYNLQNISPSPKVDQVNFNGTATLDEGSAEETELDAEFSGMMAPGAQIHVFTSAANSDQGELDLFTAILDDNRAKLVNYSWGGCETSLSPQHKSDMQTVFARAVAQGVNIFVASGDSGSDSCNDGTTAADWPGASPYVTAVGGTTLNFDGQTRSETGWSGSGGGISAIWDLPNWQQSLTSPFVKRSYPDVSFNADPSSGQAVYTTSNGQTGFVQIGGTSMASPQWVGFMALVAEARASQGRADLGYVAPLFYQMSDADRANAFHDVTSGNNGAYSCSAGWDAVTGFGSMQADALAAYLQNI